MELPDDISKRPFLWRDARAAGLTRRGLDALVEATAVRRILTHVYAAGNVADTVELRAAAAALVLAPHQVICDESSAWLDEIDTLAEHERGLPHILRTVAPDGLARTTRSECKGMERYLLERDIELVAGVRKTTPRRTCMDLARKRGPLQALATLDQYLHRGLVTKGELLAELPRFKGFRGVRQARLVIGHADGRSESTGESMSRMRVIQEGLPLPDLQFWVTWHGRDLYRLDLSWPHLKVVVEYDGREFHDSDADREQDEDRREWLRRRGWHVIVVDKTMLSNRTCGPWLAELRGVLRDRSGRAL